MATNKSIPIEIVYAAQKQMLIAIEVPLNTSIEEAIALSNIKTHFPEIDLVKQKVGVFSQPRTLTDMVHAGERIEIYRPLIIDPKEARRAKARRANQSIK